MSILQRIFRPKTAAAEPAPKPVTESQSGAVQADSEKSFRIVRGSMVGDSLARSIAGASQLEKDPRNLMEASRLIVELIPELSCGLGLHLQVMGEIEAIECENEQFKAEFAKWMQSARWKTEIDHAFDQTVGLAELVRLMAWQAMVDGMAFIRAVDQNGVDNINHRQGVPIFKLHDSARFSFTEFQPDKFWLDYESAGQIAQNINPGDYLRALYYDRLTGYPWGVPITSKALEAAKIHLRTQQNHLQSLDLTASAALATLISMTPPPDLLESDIDMWKKERAEAQAIVEKFTSDLVEGIKASKAQGKRYQQFVSTSSKIDMQTLSLAQGVTINPNYTEDRKAMLSSVVIGAGIQPDFVGLSVTGGGLGDQKWQTSARAMESTGLRMRNPVWQIVKHFWELYCKRASIQIAPVYTPKWKGLQLTEESAMLAAEKLKAEIAEKHVINTVAIFDTLGALAANAYAEENGLSYNAPIA